MGIEFKVQISNYIAHNTFVLWLYIIDLNSDGPKDALHIIRLWL